MRSTLKNYSRRTYIATILLLATIGIVTLAIGSDELIKYIGVPREKGTTEPEPYIYLPQTVNPLTEEEKRRVIEFIEESRILEEVVKTKTEYNIRGVTPRYYNNEIIGGCVTVKFPKHVWLEMNTIDLEGKPFIYMGWAMDLTICVNLREKRLDGVAPSLVTHKGVPEEIPPEASSEARRIAEDCLRVAAEFLRERYNLSREDVKLLFYGVADDVAYVEAFPKSMDKFYEVSIFMKIDADAMEVMMAYKQPIEEVYVNPKYVNSTKLVRD